ncbi:MAG: hypothetical protein WBK20_15930 [Spirochaetota bacterium]
MDIRKSILLFIMLLLVLPVIQCDKKFMNPQRGEVKEEKMEEIKIIEGPAKYQGLWWTNDIRMAGFVGHKGKLKYPDYYMLIDVQKGEVKLRFVYDDTKTDYTLKIEFIDETNAKVINAKGEVRELAFRIETYLKTGDKQHMVCEFKDTKGDQVIVAGRKEGVFGRFIEGVSSYCTGWDTIESCVQGRRGQYEIAEIEANAGPLEGPIPEDMVIEAE